MRKALLALIQRAHFSHGESYDRYTARLFGGIHRRVAEDVAATAPAGGTVLDAGCGSGRLAVLIARRRPDLQVRGVDLEPGMVQVAARRAEQEDLAGRVHFTAADLADLPLPDHSVDLIVSTASLHHWADAGAVVASLGRVLRPSGQMWIYDFRVVPAGRVRSAAHDLGGSLDRTLVRTGRSPVALFQRLAVGPMPSSPSTDAGTPPAHPADTR
jgi:ubiquinone/menaquinone biosynthesis C-methylase UbiE